MIKKLWANPLWLLFCEQKAKNRLLTAFTLFFNMIAALLEGVSFAFILYSFSVLSGDRPALFQEGWFKNHFSSFSETQLFSLLMLGAVLSQILRSAFTYFGQMLTVKLTVNLQSDAQNLIYRKIFNMPFADVNRYKVGDLIQYATAPPMYFRYVTDWINRLIVSAMMIVAYTVFMIWLSFSLTVCTLGMFILSAILQKTLIGKIIKASQSHTDHIVELNKETSQNLSGLKTIHLFDRCGYVLDNIKNTLDKIGLSSIRLNKWNQLVMPVNEMIAVGLVAGTMMFSLYFLKGEIFAVLLTFLALTYRLGTRLQVLMCSCGEIAYNMGPVKRLTTILQAEGKEFVDDGDKLEGRFEREIWVDKLTFKYEGKLENALEEISMKIEKGKTIALVGPSGGGKSTLLDLMLRLYNPAQGSIYVDGKPITDYSITFWRKKFGVVSQDIFLFYDSIEANIRFGNLTSTDEEIVEAAKLAGAHDFIQSLPHGYKTTVGEKGHRLSGGERQRISLARALVRKPEILVLDEATSHLDSQTERYIQEALVQLRGKMTILMVAHRLATINMADQIFVLDHGRIVEQGTHHDLIQLRGRYHHLWSLQSTHQEEIYALS